MSEYSTWGWEIVCRDTPRLADPPSPSSCPSVRSDRGCPRRSSVSLGTRPRWAGTALGRCSPGTRRNLDWIRRLLGLKIWVWCKPVTLQAVPQLAPLTDVPEVPQFVVNPVVIDLLEVVQPDLGQPHWVLLEDVTARPPLVRRARSETYIEREAALCFSPEYVTHVWAREDLKATSTHPNFEGELKIFSSSRERND